MKDVWNFFKTPGYTLTQFRNEWMQLTDLDKEQLRAGVVDGTLNY